VQENLTHTETHTHIYTHAHTRRCLFMAHCYSAPAVGAVRGERHTRTYAHILTHTYTRTHTHTRTQVPVYGTPLPSTSAGRDTRTYVHIHTHTYTRTHTHAGACLWHTATVHQLQGQCGERRTLSTNMGTSE
jgi:hypothetical protein